jgi:beta-galactosidase
MLAGLSELAAARTPARVALVYDFENEWALNLAFLPRTAFKEYQAACIRHYANFWRMGIAIDLVSARDAFEGYALVLAPMLHLIGNGTAERQAEYVASGGILVTTFLTGWVGDTDLVHLGGYPAPLDEVLGITMTEFDTFGLDQQVRIEAVPDNPLGLAGTAAATRYAELLEPVTAEVLAVYASEFYRGTPALTVNRFGEGAAYHLGTHPDDGFLTAFYRGIAGSLADGIGPVRDLPEGATIQMRVTSDAKYLFTMNFQSFPQTVRFNGEAWSPIDGGDAVTETVLPGFGITIFKQTGTGEHR